MNKLEYTEDFSVKLNPTTLGSIQIAPTSCTANTVKLENGLTDWVFIYRGNFKALIKK